MGELDIVFPVSPVSESEHESSDVGAEDDDDPVDDHQAGQEAQEQQPEPDKDVDLLIDCKQIVNQYWSPIDLNKKLNRGLS